MTPETDAPARIKEPGDVLRIVYAMHWDMAACPCWICEAARALGCKGTTADLDWRREGFAYVDANVHLTTRLTRAMELVGRHLVEVRADIDKLGQHVDQLDTLMAELTSLRALVERSDG